MLSASRDGQKVPSQSIKAAILKYLLHYNF